MCQINAQFLIIPTGIWSGFSNTLMIYNCSWVWFIIHVFYNISWKIVCPWMKEPANHSFWLPYIITAGAWNIKHSDFRIANLSFSVAVVLNCLGVALWRLRVPEWNWCPERAIWEEFFNHVPLVCCW